VTLLAYALLTEPNPLQASADATLTLVVSNSGRDVVTVESVTVTLPVGTNAKDLIANAGGIVTQPQSGWSVAQSGGSFTLTPDTPAAARVGPSGLVFVFANVAVNAQPGTSAVTFAELASSPSQPLEPRTASASLAKFPQRFRLGELTATPANVASGGSTTVMWSGSPASYTLAYDPAGAGPVTEPVANAGPFTARNLTNPAGVTFTLQATVTVPGQDQPLVVQRQVTVGVSVPKPAIAYFTGTLTGAGTPAARLVLAWSVRGVPSCSISGYPSLFNATDSMTIVPSASAPLRATYTLSASNAAGRVCSEIAVKWTEQPNPIAVPENPQNITIPRDGGTAYLSSRQQVAALDLSRLLTVRHAATPRDFLWATVSPDGALLYLCGPSVTVLDADTFAPAGEPIPLLIAPYTGSSAISPDGRLLFVAAPYDKSVAVVDTRARSRVTLIAVGSRATSVAVSPDGTLAFVLNFEDDTVSVIDVAALRVTGGPIAVGPEPSAIAFAPDGTRAYVNASKDGTVWAIDVASRAPAGPPVALAQSAWGLAVAPAGDRVVAAGGGYVSMLQANPLELLSTTKIAVGGRQSHVQISPDGVVILVCAFDANVLTTLLPSSVSGGVPRVREHNRQAGAYAAARALAAPALLTYAALTEPDPLRAGTSATLTLVISNGTRQIVTVESITVTLPVGTTAKTLTASPNGIATPPTPGWDVAQSGGSFTLTPQTAGAAQVGAAGLVFVFANVDVNDQPGTCTVTIVEVASSPSQPNGARNASFALAKFPVTFNVSQLTLTPTQIDPGDSVALTWFGSPATYTLSYNPSGAFPVVVGVGNAGPYVATNLTKAPSITFTLQAMLTVPGQDQPLVMQRQATVDVSVPAPVITMFTGTLTGGTGTSPAQLTLTWSVEGTGLRCRLSGSPYEVAPSGSTTVPSATIPQRDSYTLTATNGSGSDSVTLTVRWAARTTTIPLPDAPRNIALSNDGSRAYVCGAKSLTVLDVAALVPIGTPATYPSELAFVNVSPDGTLLYLTSRSGKTVTVLDAATLAPDGAPIAISVQSQPFGVVAPRAALSPDGSRLFIPSGFAANTFSVVDTGARNEIATPYVGFPLWAAVTPDGARVYVTSAYGTVWVFDVTTLHTVGEPIPVAQLAFAIVAGPGGTRVYALAGDVDQVSITAIDTATRAPAGPPVAVPKRDSFPDALAVTPNGSQIVFGGDGIVSFLQADPLRLVSTVALGARTTDVQVSRDGKTVLIASTPDGVGGSVLAYAPMYVDGGVPAALTLFGGM
jgi:YVTN family beta-propeller protein